jgi:hypothetical protein
MNIDLVQKPMMGHYGVKNGLRQCEYQFGRRLIFVQYPENETLEPYIKAAQSVVMEAWQDIDAAIKFAEQLSRPLSPEFWSAYAVSNKKDSPLDVYGIRFGYPDNRPLYEISLNHDFNSSYVRYDEFDLWQNEPIVEELPVFPDIWLYVRRIGFKSFENESRPAYNR